MRVIKVSFQMPSGFLEGSKFKSVLYVGSDSEFTQGDFLNPSGGSEYGIYVSTSYRYARRFGTNLYYVYANIKNPIVVGDKSELSPGNLTDDNIEKLKEKGYDGIVHSGGREIVAFDYGQVVVIGKAV